MLSVDDRPSIADLELYGLSSRGIRVLEEKVGFLYVDELRYVDAFELSSLPNVGEKMIEEIRTALRNWVSGRQVKTVEECIHGGI